jgi:hypothetical protein
MGTWVWLAAYLVGFALLQLFLYRYFRQGESTGDGDDGHEPGYRRLERAAASHDAPDTREAREPRESHEARGGARSDRDGIRCRHCGASNDPDGTFTYCRNCAEPLR